MKNRQSKTSCLEEISNKHIGELEASSHEVLKSELRIDLLDKTSNKILAEKLKLESSLYSKNR